MSKNKPPSGVPDIDPQSLATLQGHLDAWTKFFAGTLDKLDGDDAVVQFAQSNPDYAAEMLDGLAFLQKLVIELNHGNTNDAVMSALHMVYCAMQMLRLSHRKKQRRVLSQGPAKRKATAEARFAAILSEFNEIMSEQQPPPSRGAARKKLHRRLIDKLGENAPSASTIINATKSKREAKRKRA